MLLLVKSVQTQPFRNPDGFSNAQVLDPLFHKGIPKLGRVSEERGEYPAPGDNYRGLEDDLIVQNYQLERELSKTFQYMKHSNEEGTSTYSDDLDDDISGRSEVSVGFGNI
ncbi:hypothetical protein BDBG_05642 [Blastomyces gilchristii SLH14081]|uniref:Uncharacterized protein n=1 Tax=Blastomyces gilchristii (strain SLH14081) TaxID=559298 RepID=A0A179UPM1_BLAGS|nr:uncharacterized protein BDBG_05642 [Blastomyces gilchristii SLH14081]OAT09954.1 hypothetical protein BDBG_05642 [Blastomyces gilchristii SLH14081]